MFLQRNHFQGLGASPLDAVTNGPHWAAWPDRVAFNLAPLITSPTAEGGSIGGLGNILNNMASMVKSMDNMRRAASVFDAQRMDRAKRLGVTMARDHEGNVTYTAA